ncbi:MAG: hypothetical protein QOJ40_2231 [Verrucomicrobiota bacterium]
MGAINTFRLAIRAVRAPLFWCGLLAFLPATTFALQSVALIWSPSPDAVAGYNIYYGPASGAYTNRVSTGNVTNATIFNLVEGATYYFVATAFDSSGDESTPSNEKSYTIPSQPPPASGPLTLITNGNGAISPALTGKTLTVGKTYTLAAIPAKGQEFAGWSGSLTSSAPKLTFVLTSNFVVQANFVPSPFIPVSGAYNGLFYEDDMVRQYSAGFFSLSVTPRGAYNGRLQLGASRRSFSGRLDLQCQATNVILRPNDSPLRIELRIGSGSQSDQVLGLVTDGIWVSTLAGYRAVFNSRTNPAPWAGEPEASRAWRARTFDA